MAATPALRAIVCIKRVVDYTLALRLRKDGLGIDTVSPSVKHILNPFDETALEAALQLKERKIVSSVTALAVGPKESVDVLRTALAMGADDATLVIEPQATSAAKTPSIEVTASLQTAHILAAQVKSVAAASGSSDSSVIVLMGKQSVDSDMGTTGAYLGALLGWPTVSAVTTLQTEAEAGVEAGVESKQGQVFVAHRLRDVGEERVRFSSPAVVTTDLRLNTPRFVSLPGIMKAKKRQIPILKAEEVLKKSEETQISKLLVKKVTLPEGRKAGIMVKSVDELIDKLRNTSKVI